MPDTYEIIPVVSICSEITETEELPQLLKQLELLLPTTNQRM